MGAEYHAYLASREWALKREAVRRRSGNRCERCNERPQQAVHHLTYKNLGDEPLHELQAICNPCHEYLSGVREDDPMLPTERVTVIQLTRWPRPCPCCQTLIDDGEGISCQKCRRYVCAGCVHPATARHLGGGYFLTDEHIEIRCIDHAESA